MILEEIRMTQDNPEDLVHELFTQNFWNPHALGRPILGTPETVSCVHARHAAEWFRRWYAPNQSGDHGRGTSDARAARAISLPSVFRSSRPSEDGLAGRRAAGRAAHHAAHQAANSSRCTSASAFRRCRMADRRRFAVSVLNNILGGGMSSRLFQNIRERLGLAYAIFSEMQLLSRRRRAFGLCGHVA